MQAEEKERTVAIDARTQSVIEQMNTESEKYAKEVLSRAKAQMESDGLIKDTAAVASKFFKYRLKENLLNIGIFLYLVALVCYLVYSGYHLILSFIKVNPDYSKPDAFMCIVPILSIVVFMFSTLKDYWNFHRRKYSFVIAIVVSITMMIVRLTYYFTYCALMPLLIKIPPHRAVSKEMLVFLFQLCTILPSLILTFLITKGMLKTCFTLSSKQAILGFKLNKYVDFRKNKKYSYDMHFVRRLFDGSNYVVREMDRFLHTLINGASGTGKTSSTLIVRISDDLDKRCLNEDMQKKKALKLLKKNKAYMKESFDDEHFSIDKIAPKPGFEKEYQKIIDKYRICGITVVAPNYGLTDDIYEFCKIRSIPCNRIDPIPLYDGTHKEGFIGFNPLYISPLIPEWSVRKEVIKRATLFADVLQSVNELKGKGDPYFTALNRSITTTVTICLCITYPILEHRQPTPSDVQSVVNDFKRISPYYKLLNEIDTDNSLQFVRDFIKDDMLGEGKDKMIEQSRGLRTIMNEFLTNPLIKQTICSTGKTIDMDEMLSKGEVTVVNYALELGNTDSIGFGLFFVLSFIDAVLRRPGNEKTRIPHFLDIDELPVILHPTFERALSLFRQYRCGITACIQSIDQMLKSETTKYLKLIFMGGCAHHVVFGRCGVSEMEEYSKLAGKEWRTQEMTAISETALSLENTSASFSTRTSESLENSLEGTSIRNPDFQEVTVFSVVSGNLVPPFAGKVAFLKRERKLKVKRIHVEWDKIYKSCYSTLSDAPQEILTETYETSDETVSSVSPVLDGSSELNEEFVIEDTKLEDNTSIELEEEDFLTSGFEEDTFASTQNDGTNKDDTTQNTMDDDFSDFEI